MEAWYDLKKVKAKEGMKLSWLDWKHITIYALIKRKVFFSFIGAAVNNSTSFIHLINQKRKANSSFLIDSIEFNSLNLMGLNKKVL